MQFALIKLNPHWKRRIGIIATLLLSLSPVLYAATLLSVPMYLALGSHLFLSLCCAAPTYFLYSGADPKTDKNVRLMNGKSKKEKKILALITSLARKLRIPTPLVACDSGNSPPISASATGGPYSHPIVMISKGILKLYPKRFIKQTLKPVLAHELSHLKNQDSKTAFLFEALNKSIKLYVFFFIIITGCYSLFLSGIGAYLLYNQLPLNLLSQTIPMLLNLILTSSLLIASEIGMQLSDAYTDRAMELIADEGAAKVICNPKAMASCLDDLAFHRLHWGKIYFSSKKWGDITRLFPVKPVFLKKLYRQKVTLCPSKLRAGEYFRKISRAYTKHFDKTEHYNLSLVWKGLFLSHPSHHDRRQTLKHTFPKAFTEKNGWSKAHQRAEIKRFCTLAKKSMLH